MRVSELDKIKAAIKVLQRIKGVPKFHWVQELYLKLDETFFEQFDGPKCIDFENNDHLKSIDVLGDLFQAILKKQVLKMDKMFPYVLMLRPMSYLKRLNIPYIPKVISL